MKTMFLASAAVAAGVCVMLGGCEQASAPAPTGTGSGSITGGAQSHLGKTAEMARGLADKIQARDAATGTAAALASGSDGQGIPGLAFSTPPDWTQRTPANPMRLAEFDAGGATVTITQAGGSVEDNITRWLGQIVDRNGRPVEPESRLSRRVAGYESVVVEAFGAALDNGVRQENQGLIGAVIQSGRTMTFVKMTGSDEAVEAQRTAFTRLLDSMQPQ
jgi:hypothetical protein